ncbi:MAG: hypothetical protein JXR03_21670 [Cyclobacteriaceae bacterium]
MSVDPLSPDYPYYTPYQFAGNKPIRYVDLDGLEEYDPLQDPLLIPTLVQTVASDIRKSAINLLVWRPLRVVKYEANGETQFVYFGLRAENSIDEFGKEDHIDLNVNWRSTNSVSFLEEVADYVNIIGIKGFGIEDIVLSKNFSKTQYTQVLKRLGQKSAPRAKWIKENIDSWSDFSKKYQKQISGVEPGGTINIKTLNNDRGVNFDGVDPDGVLIDAKGKYDFLLKKGWAQEGLIEQGLRQLDAAKDLGVKVRWYFAEEGAAEAVQKIFKQNNIDIEVIHKAADF